MAVPRFWVSDSMGGAGNCPLGENALSGDSGTWRREGLHMVDALVDAEPARQRRPAPAVTLYRGPRLRLSPHREAPDPTNLRNIRRWVRQTRGPTAVDLFCGAGGLSLGLQDAGFAVLAGADVDPFSIETHVANIGGLGYLGDLADPTDFLDHLDAWGVKEVDLIAGGVPCQPFSRAGRSKIRSLVQAGIRPSVDPRTTLWRSFVRIVEAVQPRAVLLENVPDLAVWEDGAILTGFRESLAGLGYLTTAARVINAFDHSVPQHRARLFVVGLRSGRDFKWPDSEPPCTLRDAIGDLPVVPPAQRQEALPYEGPETWLQRRLRRGLSRDDDRLVYDHVTRDVRPDDAEAFTLLAPGQTYKDLPDRLRRYRSDIFMDKYNRLVWDELSRSITAHISRDAYWYIHPEQHRTLSIREAARVQTFPDRFRFAGAPSHQYRQIGNAVPPLLAEAMGRSLRQVLSRKGPAPKRNQGGFRGDLLQWHATNERSFPWRNSADPWHVLMAEVCLHRTRAEQVVPVYEALTRISPTPRDMAENPDAVREAMRSLGLRWRADRMIDMAQALVKEHEGRVPDSLEELLGLPGVGDYVANAVMVFGFGGRSVLVDTNTTRIISRVRGLERLNRWHLRSEIYDLAGPGGADTRFNYAMIDLGALTCRARDPLCSACLVSRHCTAYRQRRQP